jgi:hypothetical protein
MIIKTWYNTKNTKISPTMAEASVATSISAAPDTVNLPIYLNKEVPLPLHCRPFIETTIDSGDDRALVSSGRARRFD